MLERSLIVHCAPTLARLKVGSLFTKTCENEAEMAEEIRALNVQLREKGLVLTVLRIENKRILLYLYRESELGEALCREDVRSFLKLFGYTDFSVEAVLGSLRDRLRSSEGFPHEIGVFLGYPLSDVIAFIQNDGRNCLCCGHWKAYSDECGALRTFERFRKCKEVYMRQFAAGRPLSRLAVASRSA